MKKIGEAALKVYKVDKCKTIESR